MEMGTEIKYDKVKEFTSSANSLISSNAVEDVLRHNLSSWMPQMFPSNPWWISVHISGSETKVNYATRTGSNRGFVDTLVGKTVIEYEKNLLNRTIFDTGYNQVKDYCAALLNKGIEKQDIIGVLSDTVRWYAYRISKVSSVASGQLYGRSNIELEELEHIELRDGNGVEAKQFVRFILRYIGREGSRTLDASTLAKDMGFESKFCENHIQEIKSVVKSAFESNKVYAKFIEEIWCNFVSYVGGNVSNKAFQIDSYINEFYIMTLAKYLCANIIEGKSLISDTSQSIQIMNGNYFKTKGFSNLIEYDYFGWINNTPYADQLTFVGQSIQEDLAAYNFTNIVQEDLFGPLVAQLAQREQRILLGQEYTPQWLAEKIVKKMLHDIPNGLAPRFLDMCCGSGVFVVETLKQTIERFQIEPHSSKNNDIEMLQQAVMGFDIDPLAVVLSKVNWVLIMKEFVPYASTNLTIPIYHADSLFMVTPVSKNITRNYYDEDIELEFNGEKILLPSFLLLPQNGLIFDYLVNGCYSIAMQRASHISSQLSYEVIKEFVTRAKDNITNSINPELIPTLEEFCYNLVGFLERMQVAGKNGIWAFVLGNTYRPALVAGQFNGIVSNPPWMAMSKLHDNPYKNELESRALHYRIKPSGGAHLHIELATIFLIQAVEHYLRPGASFGCIVPDSILNGYHHEPFRKRNYNNATPPVNLNVKEIWEIDASTFKNKAVVLFGDNKSSNSFLPVLPGQYVSKDGTETCHFKLLHQGRRSAWSNKSEVEEVTEVLEQIPFLQGADIMPRTVIFHRTAKQPNGKWKLSPIKRQNDDLAYLVKDAKKNTDFSLNILNIDDDFVFKCFMSHHLTQFNVSEPANALLPIERDQEGKWTEVAGEKLATKGSAINEAFRAVYKELGFSSHDYFQKLNYRSKLNPQVFPNQGYLVLAGAGGSYTCAGYINLSNYPVDKLIVDQTLYWYISGSEDEAIYITGLLNSMALDTLIAEFQPEGLQGRRHIHKLPYAITPKFDPENDSHKAVIEVTKQLLQEWNNTVDDTIVSELTLPSTSSISVRRRKIRALLQRLPSYQSYEDKCKEVYGVGQS